MYSDFNTYIDARIAELAADTSTDLSKADVGLAQEDLPANYQDLSYMLKFVSFNMQEDTLPAIYTVNGVIELSFDVVNSDTTNYATIIDTYVYALVKKVKATPMYRSGNIKILIRSLGCEGLNTYVDGGTVLQPKITFEADYIDNS